MVYIVYIVVYRFPFLVPHHCMLLSAMYTYRAPYPYKVHIHCTKTCSKRLANLKVGEKKIVCVYFIPTELVLATFYVHAFLITRVKLGG